MPLIFGTNILTVSYDDNTEVVSLTGEAFAENRYAPVGKIEVSITGSGIWVAASAYGAWSDTAVSGTFLGLAAGTYDVRITSGDGEQDSLAAGFVILPDLRASGVSRCYISASIGI